MKTITSRGVAGYRPHGAARALLAAVGVLTLLASQPATAADWPTKPIRFVDRKSTRLNSSHIQKSRMPSSA